MDVGQFNVDGSVVWKRFRREAGIHVGWVRLRDTPML